MEAIATQETIVAPHGKTGSRNGEARQNKRAIPLEERTDLTISEVEALGITEPYELIDGRIIFKMTKSKHAYIHGKFSSALDFYLNEHPIGVLFLELSARLFPDDDRDLKTPDLGLYLNERLPEEDEFATAAPDLAVEILTSDSGFLTLLDKADLYLSKGGKVVWIAIPAKSSVLIWTATEKRWEYETLTCPELLPGWSLDLKKFFKWPKPTAVK